MKKNPKDEELRILEDKIVKGFQALFDGMDRRLQLPTVERVNKKTYHRWTKDESWTLTSK